MEITTAPPFATVQDAGRAGLRSRGIPPSGAMDPDAMACANLLVGNPMGAAVIEWALGSGRIGLETTRAIACVGASLTVGDQPVPSGGALLAPAGSEIELGLPERRFACLAVAGGICVPPVLGSRSTYLVAGFGGLEGRRLKRNDRLPIGPATFQPPAQVWGVPEDLLPVTRESIRVVPGPQSDLFDDDFWDALTGGAWAVSPASDRMGYRLDGPAIRHRGSPSMPSEPVGPGAMQVPVGGRPIVLMPDGPTVGGYPKPAAIITADVGQFAQSVPGTQPRFELVTFEEAVSALREVHTRRRAAREFLSRSST